MRLRGFTRNATAVFAAAVALKAAGPAELAIRAQLPKAVIAKRVTLGELDLVVAFGGAGSRVDVAGAGGWYTTRASVGLFLQSTADPGLVYRLGEEPVEDCFTAVELATANAVVLSCTGEKGLPSPNRKFLIDVRAKHAVRSFTYPPFAVRHAFADGGKAVLVADDGSETAAVEYTPGADPAFRVLGPAMAQRWSQRASRPSAPPAHRIPQSSYDAFAAARPGRVRNGYLRGHTTIGESMGPSVREGALLWFGKTFYDGEGHTGVGGVGFYDSTARRYEIYSPPEIADWSTTAIIVEPGAIWAGLARCGEWGPSAGGLLRFDRASRSARRWDTRGIIGGLVRVGTELVAATHLGILVFDGETFTTYMLDRTSSRRVVVVKVP